VKYRAYVVGNSENAIFFAQEKFYFFLITFGHSYLSEIFWGSQFNNFDESVGQGTVVMGENNLMQVQFIWRLSVNNQEVFWIKDRIFYPRATLFYQPGGFWIYHFL